MNCPAFDKNRLLLARRGARHQLDRAGRFAGAQHRHHVGERHRLELPRQEVANLEGAQFLFYPTAIGWLPDENPEMNEAQHSAWETIQRGHAIANGVYVVVVNRVGQEGKLTFWGQSFVADPFGRIVAKASPDQEEVLVVECDLSKIEETRQNWPFLRDRRIDAYEGLRFRFGESL